MTDTSQFRDYVTGTSFALTLSRRMIDLLCQMDHYGYAFGTPATARSLHDRGLDEWMDREKVEAGHPYPQLLKFRLTEAGKAVIPLLRLAGLYTQFPVDPEPAELPDIDVKVTLRKREDAPA